MDLLNIFAFLISFLFYLLLVELLCTGEASYNDYMKVGNNIILMHCVCCYMTTASCLCMYVRSCRHLKNIQWSPLKSNSLDSKFCLYRAILLSPAKILYNSYKYFSNNCYVSVFIIGLIVPSVYVHTYVHTYTHKYGCMYIHCA